VCSLTPIPNALTCQACEVETKRVDPVCSFPADGSLRAQRNASRVDTLSLVQSAAAPLLGATELKMCCGWGETITRTQHFKKGGGGFTETLRRRLVAVASELLGDRGGVGGGLEGSNLGLLGRDLALVERSGLDLPLLLEAVDDVAVRPAELVRDALWTTTSWSAVG
jgi:hypothetical protein